MDEKAFISQIADLFNEQNKKIDERFTQLEKGMEELRGQVQDNAAAILKTQVMIENKVAKRIETLFDGYKLTHEKQYELERDNEQLKAKIEEIETRLMRLEEKSA